MTRSPFPTFAPVFGLSSACVLALLSATPLQADTSKNIALGRSYTMNPMPRYPIGVEDPDDKTQLTDGRYSNTPGQLFWRDPLTVGWMLAAPPVIVIDLETAQPISGVSYNTAAEHGGVTWPRQILLFTSDDQKSWRMVGDLVESATPFPTSPSSASPETIRRYQTKGLKAYGRYIAFAVQPEPGKENYVFCDEIEVYGGGDGTAASHATIEGEGEEAIRSVLLRRHVLINIKKRLQLDADELAARLTKATALPTAERTRMEKHLKEICAAIPALPEPELTTFRAQYPINELHGRLLSLYGELLERSGVKAISVTHIPRYQLQSLFPTPDQLLQETPVSLSAKMLQNEHRAESLLLTNATAEKQEVRLELRDTEGKRVDMATEAPWLKVSPIPWTDTLQLEPVAAALPDHRAETPFSLLPGMSTKLWLAIDSQRLPAGRRDYRIAVIHGDTESVIPFTVEVSPVKMNRPRLSLGAWDYTNPQPGLAFTPENLPEAKALMRSHYVDMTWATRTILPWPEADAFNERDELTKPLDFAQLEQWQRDWPDARHFCIFIHARPDFAGVEMGTPRFTARVASWAKALSAKAAAMNLPLVIQIVDEPHNEKQDAIVVAWAKALRKGAPELPVVQNPTWLRPDQNKNQEALTLPHILMPYVIRYQEGGDPVALFFEARRRSGQTLWFYQCSGPIRLLDPSRYYRSFAWWAFQRHGQAITVWAFADTGVGGSGKSALKGNSWNEYAGNNFNYSPVFISPEGVTDSLHWQAMREGVQDHEYLAMLADLLNDPKQTQSEAWRNEALGLLERGPAEVLDAAPLDARWHHAKAPADLPDQWRLQALALLESAAALTQPSQP